MTLSASTKLESYPPTVHKKIIEIRQLIFDIAEKKQLGVIVESLKWGELSYVCKGGSPIRIDWKTKTPDKVSVFFNCNTQLVETFRELFADRLQLNGKRELLIPLTQPLPQAELNTCFAMALQYHKLKNLPLLGA